MTFYNRNGEKKEKRLAHDFRRHEEEVVRSLCRLGSRPISPRSMQEEEKRIRREIANSNERRRMQSINSGFQYLRKLLPHREGEKLSKASILQQTADFIYQLEQEKACLLEQTCQLKRRAVDTQNVPDSDGSCSDSPFSKRRKREIGDLIDEGLGSSPSRNDSSEEDMKRELVELRYNLEHERAVRAHLEEQVMNLEAQLNVTEKVYDVALQDHVSYHSTPEGERKHRIINLVVDNSSITSSDLVTSLKVESFHEVPQSPKLLTDEVPEDLSGKNNSSPHHYEKEVLQSNATTILHLSPSSFSAELEVKSQREPYKPRSSRPNLETIVEAIRHVEGDHMFRDDPSPRGSPVRRWSEEEPVDELYEEQSYETLPNQSPSLQHQIVTPVSQSRPGVIVSRLS